MGASDPDQIPLFGTPEQRSALLSGYRPLPAVRDELIGTDGGLQKHWAPLLDALTQMGAFEVERRFGFADRHLRDTGVVHRIYDARGGAERPLPLSHVPLVISQADWTKIEAAVIQRADLINKVIADIYGEQTLVRSGDLPAALVAGNPEFLRPMVGVKPAGGSHLLFYAVDIGRGPDGDWWILRDYTESPSGAGYTVENRIALSRALPELYQPLNVRRLANFFGGFRDSLAALSAGGRRVGLLSAGAYNEAAFEHAYLARYLGFLLLEGEDLVVRDDKLFASTTSGLQPIDVILRRLDADFADPLLFNAGSWIGTPGLGLAAQAGNLVVANALGSGVVEAAGLLGILPELSRTLLNEDLKLKTLTTRWCGQPDAQAAVLADLDSWVIAPAFGPILPGLLDDGAVHVRDVSQTRHDQIAAAIAARGIDFVAQEAMQLSTMPVWSNGRLQPRPFLLRVYAARCADGWQVLPGGFCQVADSVDPRAVSLQRGSAVADVWVLSDKAEQRTTLLPSESSSAALRARDVLPTRTAENLFWLGRYVERAENAARLARALATRLIGFDAETDEMIPLITRLAFESGAVPTAHIRSARDADTVVLSALTDPAALGSVRTLLLRARGCAAKTRDQISPAAWTILNDAVDLSGSRSGPPSIQQDLDTCNEILHHISAFAGLADNNMNRLSGWHFLQLGHCIERAINIAALTNTLAREDAPPGAYEALLELADCQVSFGTLYSSIPTRAQVIDLVLLDAFNPRSLAYQGRSIEDHMKALPDISDGAGPSGSRKGAINATAHIGVLSLDDVTAEQLASCIADLSALSDAITADYFVHWRSAPAEADE